jgi:hypothetical protein
VPYGSICSVAPPSICRSIELFIVSGPVSYGLAPAGTPTVPPPAVEAALIAAWMALVSSVEPFARAP